MRKAESQSAYKKHPIKLSCDADIAIKFHCSQSELYKQIDFNLSQIIHEFNRLILADKEAKSIYFEEQ